jgi:hypothetical protein
LNFGSQDIFCASHQKIFSCRIVNPVRLPDTEKKSAAGMHDGRVLVLFNIGRYAGRATVRANLSPYSEAELA